jgi:lipopolysaccharide transport system ATP-binding protein
VKLILDIDKGVSIGTIGRNGSGKSTLLQLIAGVLQPTTGQISVKTKRVAALLELGSSFEPDFTGRENVLMHGAMLDIPEEENQARLKEVLDFSEIGEYFEQPVRTYSTGMMLRLAFASSITLRPELLIVDEALAVGDIFFQQRCFQKIRELVERGVTILLVSHDLRSISEFCEKTLLLHQGRVDFFGDSNAAINLYYGLTQSYRLLTATESPTPSSDGIEKGTMAQTSSEIVLEPVKSMHPDREAAARFVGLAVLDKEGKHTGLFRQGDWLTVVYDIEVRAEIENLSCGIANSRRSRVFPSCETPLSRRRTETPARKDWRTTACHRFVSARHQRRKLHPRTRSCFDSRSCIHGWKIDVCQF